MKAWCKNHKYDLIILALGIASGAGLIFSFRINWLYGVLQSFFAGFIFWLLVVFIPEIRQRFAVHKFLKNRYREFRLSLLNNFLSAAGVWEFGKAEELLDHDKFKAFFQQYIEPHQVELLYVAESGIDKSPPLLSDIKVSFKHFSDEIDFALNGIASSDFRVYDELNFLRKRLYDLFHLSCYTADPSKYIGQFFWNTLGWWNEVSGDRPSDWIADAIEKLK